MEEEMSAARATNGSPDHNDDKPGSGDEERTTGSRANETASAPAEEVIGEAIALDFGIHKSIRYHTKRRAFFDGLHRVAMLAAVIGGSGTFFALIGEKTHVGQIAALVVA